MTQRQQQILIMIQHLKRGHTECDDPWYSCPMSMNGCANNEEHGCTCGADQTNVMIDQIIALLHEEFAT